MKKKRKSSTVCTKCLQSIHTSTQQQEQEADQNWVIREEEEINIRKTFFPGKENMQTERKKERDSTYNDYLN